MPYLLDANVFIRANEDYYPIERVPQFWDWLMVQAIAGTVKTPLEILDEVHATGDFGKWMGQKEVREALALNEEVDPKIFNNVLNSAYASDLNDTELEEIGRDPFLLAYALMGKERTVVTKETSRPSKLRDRRKVPDACGIMKVRWITDFAFYRELDFRISR